MIKCRECKLEKEANNDNFAFRSIKKGTFQTICKPCWKIYRDNHYKNNRKHYIETNNTRTRKRLEENTQELLKYLAEHPCTVCGENDPLVLEFDHLDSDKEFCISAKMRSRIWANLQEEINKCQVLCANCHRRKTAKQFGHIKYLLSGIGVEETY